MQFLSLKKALYMQLLVLFLGFNSLFFVRGQATPTSRYTFVVRETPYTRLCNTKNILTINGQFPGPTIYAHKGDTIVVDVINQGDHNITLHWHGVKQPRYPWSDGPEYITQCPIKPGSNFSQKVIFSTEEGTLWWHAHSDWSRATIHGVIVVYPQPGTPYPFPKPDAEIPIVFGEWWIRDVWDVYEEALRTGAAPNVSDAYTINGQPGDLYPCSKSETFTLTVDYGKTYLLRFVNAALQEILFFFIEKHELTVVGTDASYTKPLQSNYITIAPGQTMDVLLKANQSLQSYYMAARAYSSGVGIAFDNTTTTALLKYSGNHTTTSSSGPFLPYLPAYNDTNASLNFTSKLRSLADKNHPVSVPINITKSMMFTLSINLLPCANNSCGGPNGSRLAASMNNISFSMPTIDVLTAYYNKIRGVYGVHFPNVPPFPFNYTADILPLELEIPKLGTEVKVLEFNSTVEIVWQGTNLVAGIDHPMHLHGTSFYVVGWGLGNFDKDNDPLTYNLVDPPLQNTIAVPKNGWTTIRFLAKNPGVWFMHCHIERHLTWGMKMAFIVKNGNTSDTQMLPPPPDRPPC